MVSTPLKNISQIGNLPQIGVKIKNVWNHHPDNGSTLFNPLNVSPTELQLRPRPGQLDEELHQQPHWKVHTPAPESRYLCYNWKRHIFLVVFPNKQIIPLFGTYVTLIWRYNGGRGVTWRFLTLTLKFHLTTSSSHWLSLASTAFSTPRWLLEQTTGSQGTLHNKQKMFFTAAESYLDTIDHLALFHSKDRPNILKHGIYVK